MREGVVAQVHAGLQPAFKELVACTVEHIRAVELALVHEADRWYSMHLKRAQDIVGHLVPSALGTVSTGQVIDRDHHAFSGRDGLWFLCGQWQHRKHQQTGQDAHQVRTRC